jgi:hypothetical protein
METITNVFETLINIGETILIGVGLLLSVGVLLLIAVLVLKGRFDHKNNSNHEI